MHSKRKMLSDAMWWPCTSISTNINSSNIRAVGWCIDIGETAKHKLNVANHWNATYLISRSTLNELINCHLFRTENMRMLNFRYGIFCLHRSIEMRTPALIKVEICKNKYEWMYRTIGIFRQKHYNFSIHTIWPCAFQ